MLSRLFSFLCLLNIGIASSFALPHARSYLVAGTGTTRQHEQPVLHPQRTSLVLTLRGGEQPQEEEAFSDPDTTSSSTRTSQMSMITTAAVSFGQFYVRWLERAPIRTKSVTAGLVLAMSDYLAQTIERRGSSSSSSDGEASTTSYDTKRTVAAGLVGLLYFGPAAHYWYENIFKLFPATGLVSTLQKALMGQLIFGPSFTCIFFATSLLQAGEFSFGNWFRKIQSDLAGAWLAGAGFWPLVDLVSYSLVPPRFIPLFVNLCALVWNIYLSLVANRKAKTATA